MPDLTPAPCPPLPVVVACRLGHVLPASYLGPDGRLARHDRNGRECIGGLLTPAEAVRCG